MPPASDAVARIVTVDPITTVAPEAGEVTETVGGVVSGGVSTCVVADRSVDQAPSMPALLTAATWYQYVRPSLIVVSSV